MAHVGDRAADRYAGAACGGRVTHIEMTCERCGGKVVLDREGQGADRDRVGVTGDCECGVAYRLVGGTFAAVDPNPSRSTA